jgi:hypothetical protein
VTSQIRKDPVAASYGCPVDSGRDDAAEGGRRIDATPDLLLKHPKTTVTNIRLKAVETLETCF